MRASVDPRKCCGCGECAASCPREAIREPSAFCCSKCVKYCLSMDVPCAPREILVCADLCDGCGKCLAACPTGALSLRGGDAP